MDRFSRRHLHLPGGFQERIASGAVSGLGSFRYLVVQTGIIICWITANVIAFVHHFDPYPFILLNLVFSTQAAYAAPLILLAQNRQDEKDRKRDDLEAQEVAELHEMNRTQLRMLEAQGQEIALLRQLIAPEELPCTPSPS